jgi:hypothetical protein
MTEADRQLADIKILQKVNRAHREAFAERFDGQIEHILRLLCERLQTGLDKRGNVDITRVETWQLSPAELADLSEAIYHIHLIRTLENTREKNGL